MNRTVALTVNPSFKVKELGDLYESVGWTVYTADLESLHRATANSTYVVAARSDGQLIGLARALSDDVSIFYLQDLLVRPDWQRRGVGRQLLERCLARFDHVRQKVLLTDDGDAQHQFYESMGYTNTTEFGAVELHTFVRIAGIDPAAAD